MTIAATLKKPNHNAPTKSNEKTFLTNDNCLYNVGIKDERTVASSTTVNTIPPKKIIIPNDNYVYSVRSNNRYHNFREPRTFSCCVIS